MWLVLTAAALLGRPASAQDLDTFELSSGLFDGQGTLQLLSPRLNQPGAWYAGVGLTVADDPVVIEPIGAADEATALIERQLATRLAAGYTLGERARLELALPLYPSVVIAGERIGGLGDLRIGATLPLVGAREGRVAVGVTPTLSLPTGSLDAFVTAGGFGAGALASGALALGPVALALNAGFMMRPASDLSALSEAAGEGVVLQGGAVGAALPGGLGVSWPLSDALSLGAELDGQLDLAGAGGSSYTENPVELHLFGARRGRKGLVVSLGAGTGLVAAAGVPVWRGVLGLGWSGAEPEAAVVEACPGGDCGDPNIDSDGDGLVDGHDLCPQVVGPYEAGGCPDDDGDHIPNLRDECPQLYGLSEYDGCPRVLLTEGELVIREKIYFDYDKETIRPESYDVIDEVARVLAAHPEIALIEVQGHTDSKGNAEYNLELSRRRAEAVVAYLVEEGGIARDRLDPVGFGESQPLVEGNGEDARARNRRVQFIIVNNDFQLSGE